MRLLGGVLKFIGACVLLLWAIGYLSSRQHQASPAPTVAQPPATATKAAAAAPTPAMTDVEKKAAREKAVAEFRKNGGAWSPHSQSDEITGKVDFILSTPAQSYARDKFGRTVKATLVAQCARGKTAVVVSTDTFISTNPSQVVYRVDKKPPVTQSWTNSTDYEAVFAPRSIALVKELQTADEFRVRLSPHGESSMDFMFVVSGMDVYVPRLRKACGW